MFLMALVIAAMAGSTRTPQAEITPILAVAYRGTPAGVPRTEDLSAVREAGFTGVTWTPGDKTGFEKLATLANPLNLTPVARSGVTIKVDRGRPDLQALLWRAVAGGGKVITIDPGQTSGTGLTSAKGARLPWTYTASSFASQLSSSARLFAVTHPGPAVTFEKPAPKGVEIALLDGGRAWVLIATSTALARASVVAHLPAEVPPALWVSLIDGGTMSMLRQESGPKWSVTIEPGAALVFVIDKAPR